MTAASIVITNHGYGRFLGAAIESALDQTTPAEVVVVDDGSPDDSLAVAEAYGDRITLIAKENGGQGSAINTGFDAAAGDVVFFLDADDLLAPDAVASVLAAFDADPDAVRVQFRLQWVDGSGHRIDGGFPEPDRRLPAGDLRPRLLVNPADIGWQPTSGNAFRAGTLKAILPMPAEPYRVSADHFLSNLSALHGPIAAIERPLGSYRVHGANADHRSGFDLARARDIITRTAETHRHLIARGRELGLTVPPDERGFLSLTQAGLRVASLRSGAGHPLADDRLIDAVRDGLRSAAARTDLNRIERLLASAWILALATVPRPLVGPVAAKVLTR